MERESPHYQPQLVEEVETLLKTPFFTDEIDYSLYDPGAENQGFRRAIYRAACRLIAETRADDRQMADKQNYNPETWNSQWELTTRKLGEIAFQYTEQVDFMSRQLALANGADTYITEHWDDIKTRLRSDQQEYMLEVPETLFRAPHTITHPNKEGIEHQYAVQGTTIVAPTGFGKTRLMETCIKMFSPGKELTSTNTTNPVRVVVVSPSIVIVEQNAAALRQAIPEASVGCLYTDDHTPDADIVVVTIDAFNAYFKDNQLLDYPVDVVMIDEAHHLSQSQFRQNFLNHWRGHTIGFTATPAYDLHRDVRTVIPHIIEKRDTISSIEEGILNDQQLFTFIINDAEYLTLLERYGVEPTNENRKAIAREVIDTLVIEFMTPLLEEGRRGIVFCERGNEAENAQRFAERLSLIELASGANVRAKAMYAKAANQRDIVSDFRDGLIDVVTTVDTGREGLDADFDFVIVNTSLLSRLRGHQIVGRGMRASDRFPVTVYAQFIPDFRGNGARQERRFSLEEVFGNSHLTQGRPMSQSAPASPSENHRASHAVDPTLFPDIINELLARVDNKPIGEVLVGYRRGQRAVTEGHIPLPEILEGYSTSAQYAKKLLRQAGYVWQGRMVKDDDGKSTLVHYYAPDARDYLHEVLPKGRHLTLTEVAEHFDVSTRVIRHIVKNPENDIPGKKIARDTKGKRPTCYDDDEVEKIAAILKAIPGMQPGDLPLKEIALEYGVDEQTAWRLSGATDKDRYHLRGMVHLTAVEVARVRESFRETPMAEPGEMYLASLSKASGVTWQVIDRNLTDTERTLAVPKRYKDARGFTRQAPHWDKETSQKILTRIEKFRPRGLPAHILPSRSIRSLIANIGVTPAAEVQKLLNDNGFAFEEILILETRGMSRCLSWPAIAFLEQHYGRSRSKNIVPIDYDKLPAHSDDLDPDKIAYAQSIQQLFFTPKQLRDYTAGS